MSKTTKNTFRADFGSEKKYHDSEPVTQQVTTFNLTEKVDPKKSGVMDFGYDSEKARNFDETNVKKSREGAKEILRDAINKAKTKAIEIREEARKLGYEEGFEDGFGKGEKEAREEFAPFFKAINNLVSELSRFRNEMYPKVEKEMIEMVVSLAQKVIHRELSTREDGIQDIIMLGVKSVLDKESMVIKLHPSDKGYAESFRPELHQLFDEIKNITFEATPAIERGGCVIESNFGTVDARLENLAEEIEKILSLTPVSFQNEAGSESEPESSPETQSEPPAPEQEPEMENEDSPPTKEQ